MKLAGRVAIVTGGSRGLGSVIAHRLRDAGAIVVDGNSTNCDVSRVYSMRGFVEGVIHRHGRIDILVNNAGILGPVGNLDDNDWAEWEHTISVNLMGAVYMTRAVLPIMKKLGRGKIINIAGGGAADPLPRRSAYAASKAALVRFSECVAAEVAGHRIDVNCVAPGPMVTDMLDDIIAAGPEHLGNAEYQEHVRLRDEGATPPDLAARLCVYLASPDSDGVSGRTIAARWDHWPFSDETKHKLRTSDLYTLRRVKEVA